MRRCLLALALLAPPAFAEPVSYAIDPSHTDVVASWSHFGFSNPSLHVGSASGTIVFDADNPAASRVDVSLPVSALTSHVPALDEHLLGEDFFNAAAHPTARFTSRHIVDHGNGHLEIHGSLSLNGHIGPVTLHAQLNGAGEHPMTGAPTVGFDATGTLKRSDFGLGAMAPAVGDEVSLRITTEASAPTPKA